MAEACFSMRVVKAEITKNRRRQLAELFVNIIRNFSKNPKSHFWIFSPICRKAFAERVNLRHILKVSSFYAAKRENRPPSNANGGFSLPLTENRRRQLAEIFVNAILNLTARAKIALLAKRTPFVAYLRPQRVNAPRVLKGVPF